MGQRITHDDPPPMPTTQAEWEVHWFFYRLTIRQRDAAWRELARLELRELLDDG